MKHCIAAVVCLVLAGCGKAADLGVELAPVSGVVLLDGKPMPNPVVTFYPEKGPTGIGIADANGAFTIQTNGQAGAPIGKCKVTVVPGSGEMAEMDGNEAALNEQPAIDPRFASSATTTLSVTVPAEGLPDVQLGVTAGK